MCNEQISLVYLYLVGVEILWKGSPIPPYADPTDVYRVAQEIEHYSIRCMVETPASEYIKENC